MSYLVPQLSHVSYWKWCFSGQPCYPSGENSQSSWRTLGFRKLSQKTTPMTGWLESHPHRKWWWLGDYDIGFSTAHPIFGCLFPRASERRVLPIVGVCLSSSHLLIFTSSHLHIWFWPLQCGAPMCPPVISWFINPINYSYICHKP